LPQAAVTTLPDRPALDASIRAHMEFLAGDALNGRGSGTRDEWIAVTYAAAQMRRLGLEAVDPGGFVQTIVRGEARTWNAVGRLAGADPAGREDVILLSAHIDHLGNRAGQGGAADTIYNGADDDASGTTAVLELMERLARGPRPRRSIVFALFGSEERGGLGSRTFADVPTVPLPQIVANLQFEMIGRPDGAVAPRTVWLTGFERSTLGPELARRGARLVPDPHPEMNFFERSDNIEFARRGVVAHTVASYGLHKEYHSPADQLDLIDFAHMADAIASLVEPIRWLANSDFRPEWRPGMMPERKQ
jgi:Zn-dependent M28 family amino/carboxypeptidase